MTAVRALGEPQPVKLTLQDFELLHRSGAFDRQSKVELIEGILLRMNPQRVRHSHAKSELGFRLRQRLSEMASPLRVLIEVTVAMPPDSAPEPDIVLTSVGKDDRYTPLDTVSLLIEVADSSVAFDLREKAALYCQHAVPEYWVLDIPAGTIRMFWSPSDQGYRESRSVAVGERIESATIADLAVETDGLI